MSIEEIDKPAAIWCPHCKPGSGCKIYEDKPPSCQSFQCLWLIDEALPDEMFPQKSKVILDQDAEGSRLIARCDPATPTAWRSEPAYSQLKNAAAWGWNQGKMVVAVAQPRLWLITPDRDIDLGNVDPRSPFAVQVRWDGTIDVKILPPLSDDQEFDAVKSAASLGWATPKR